MTRRKIKAADDPWAGYDAATDRPARVGLNCGVMYCPNLYGQCPKHPTPADLDDNPDPRQDRYDRGVEG